MKYSCEECKEHLFEYIDGELTIEQSKAVEAHIAICPACEKELSECRKMLSLIGESKAEVPNELYSSVMKKIKSERIKRVSLIKRIGSIAAMFVFVVGIYTVISKGIVNDRFSVEYDVNGIKGSAEETDISKTSDNNIDKDINTSAKVDTVIKDVNTSAKAEDSVNEEKTTEKGIYYDAEIIGDTDTHASVMEPSKSSEKSDNSETSEGTFTSDNTVKPASGASPLPTSDEDGIEKNADDNLSSTQIIMKYGIIDWIIIGQQK